MEDHFETLSDDHWTHEVQVSRRTPLSLILPDKMFLDRWFWQRRV